MDKEKRPPIFRSARSAIAFGGFLLGFCMYSARVNLSVAMVCMINHTATDSPRPTRPNATLEGTEGVYADGVMGSYASGGGGLQDGPYQWSKELQGIILGSFFWGYILTQFPGGFMATKFGGKWIVLVAQFMNGLMAIVTPFAADISPYLLMAVRAVQGLAQGVSFPAMNSMFGKWVPPDERGKLIAISSTGVPLGTVIAMTTSGFLCAGPGGWPSIFFLFGGACMLFVVYWFIFGSSTPAEHPRISEKERIFIEDSLGIDTEEKKVVIPWKGILTSFPVFAIVVTNVTMMWQGYTLLTNIPTYMREVLRFDIRSNGLLSAVPYLMAFGMRFIGAFLSDFLIQRKILSVMNVRKLMLGLGSIVPGAFLIATGFIDRERPMVAVTLLAIGNGFTAFLSTGPFLNPHDIAPAYAGTVFGISNTFGTVPGIVAPYVVAVMTKGKTRAEWQNVFYLTAGINMVGFIVYMLFAQGHVQEWAKSPLELKLAARHGPTPRASLDIQNLKDSPHQTVDFKGNPQKQLLAFTNLGYVAHREIDKKDKHIDSTQL